MDIGNDTDDPVDYDVDIDTGPGLDPESPDGGSLVRGRPRFFLGPKKEMHFELSETGSCRHFFLIDTGSQDKTLIELQDAPSSLETVRLKSTKQDGKTYYRIEAT